MALVLVGSAATLVVLLHPSALGHPESPTTVLSLTQGPAFASALSQPGVSPAAKPTLGTVVSTIDLVSNRVLPGDTFPPLQQLSLATANAGTIVFDSVNGDLYLRGATSDAISVIDPTTDLVVATVSIPAAANPYSAAPTIAVDTSTGYVYVANDTTDGGVTIVDGATNQVTGYIETGGGSASAVYDPDNQELYISNYNGGNVTVVSGATNATVANIAIGAYPTAILYDPASDEVFVCNGGTSTVSVIDTATNLVVKTVSVGPDPVALALDTTDNYVDIASRNLDPYSVTVVNAATLAVVKSLTVGTYSQAIAYSATNDELFVANFDSGNVTIIDQASDRSVANIATGASPVAVAFDPVDHDAYVANYGVPNVTVISAVTNTVTANLAPDAGYVLGVAVDPTSGNAFVVNSGTSYGTDVGVASNVTVIADATNLMVGSVPLAVWPSDLTVEAGSGTIVAADPTGDDAYLVDPSTNLVTTTVPAGTGPQSSAYDPSTQDLWVLNPSSNNVTVLNVALSSVASLATGGDPAAIAFDSSNGDFYVTDQAAGTVMVFDGATHSFDTTIDVKASAHLAGVLYDPHNTELYVADYSGNNVTVINGSEQETVSSVKLGGGAQPLSLTFDSVNDTVFVADSGTDNATVINDSTNLKVDTFHLNDAQYLTYDPTNDVVYNAYSGGADVSGVVASTYDLLGTIPLGDSDHVTGIAYDPADRDVYASTGAEGTLSLISLVSTYAVQFDETGLPAGASWGVTLNGTLKTSTTSTVTFTVTNYTYTYKVSAVTGYAANVTTGSVTVHGSAQTVDLRFTSTGVASYLVTFTESGLPASTLWNISLAGSVLNSTNSTIVFLETNGLYSFTVGTVAGYSASPSSGAVDVDAAPAGESITFTAGSSALSVTLTADPSTISLGGTTNFTAVTDGGNPPFEFSYPGIPSGCTSVNSSVVECTPNAAGTFTVTVTVTGGGDQVVQATTTLTVHEGSLSPSSGSDSWVWALVLGSVVAVVVLGVVFLAVRRGRKRSPPRSGSGPGGTQSAND